MSENTSSRIALHQTLETHSEWKRMQLVAESYRLQLIAALKPRPSHNATSLSRQQVDKQRQNVGCSLLQFSCAALFQRNVCDCT